MSVKQNDLNILNQRLQLYLENGISEINLGNKQTGSILIYAAIDAGLQKSEVIKRLINSIESSLNSIEKKEIHDSNFYSKMNKNDFKASQNRIRKKRTNFFSLWVGAKLSPFEWLCLKSYIEHGYDVTLYSDTSLEVPKFVKLERLQKISPLCYINKYQSSNGTSVAAFSDYFRYLGIKETGKVWIDTDNICLSDDIVTDEGYIFGPEDENYYSIGVLGLPKNSNVLRGLINYVKNCELKNDFRWGEIGPKLFTRLINENLKEKARSFKTKDFYPVHWKETSDLFLESKYSVVRMRTRNSLSIHIWNELITRSGYCKEILPQKGSYLYKMFEKHECLKLFNKKYSEEDFVIVNRIGKQ